MNSRKNAPGKRHRKGIDIFEAWEKFGTVEAANKWLINQRWPAGMKCPHCDSGNTTARKSKRITPQYHCCDCGANFTVKTGTVMHDSKLSLKKWAVAFYYYSTHLKSVSSRKLHRDLKITQKSAWHMAHRIRETWKDETWKMSGPVEVDEAFIGGAEKNKHANKKLRAGRGTVGKVPVVGALDRKTNTIQVQVVDTTDAPTLQGFVHTHTKPDAQVYTDEARAYLGIMRKHLSVKHSVGEYVKDMVSTNGIESFWAQFKRGYDGTFHHVSAQHLERYVAEFAGRHNLRPFDTEVIMSVLVQRSVGKRLTYAELISRSPRRGSPLPLEAKADASVLFS